MDRLAPALIEKETMTNKDTDDYLAEYLVAYVPLDNGEGEDVTAELTALVNLAAYQQNHTANYLRRFMRQIMDNLARKLEGVIYGER